MDQTAPNNATDVNITKFPHRDMTRRDGDKYRIKLLSDLAAKLLKTYDIVIGCDTDEFLIADPNTGMTLPQYLSQKKIKASATGGNCPAAENVYVLFTSFPCDPPCGRSAPPAVWDPPLPM